MIRTAARGTSLATPARVRVEKPGSKVFPTEPQHDATSVEISDQTSPDVGVPRARAGTERGWTFEAESTAPEVFEHTIVGPAPPAPRTQASAPVRRKPRRLVALPSLELVREPRPIAQSPIADDGQVTVPPPSMPYRPRATAVASGELSVPSVHLDPPRPRERIDDGWTIGDEPPRARGSQRHAARSATGGFPRSAAERAGAIAAQPEAAEPAVPVVPVCLAPPRLPDIPERAAPRLAQGSVTAPLPPMNALSSPQPARRRPPTVEFPTLDEDEPETDPPSDYTLIDPTRSAAADIVVPRPPERLLPSIHAVVDRRPGRAPRAPERPAVCASRPMHIGRAPFEAVPEPIAPEVAPVPRARVQQAAPRRSQAVGRSRPGPQRPSRPAMQERPARPASPRPQSVAFSESEAAFFAAGEELANAARNAPFDEELDGATPRPTLWRRLTGRHARLRR
jgi:hypothetical protein